jgi:hypothetical protein
MIWKLFDGDVPHVSTFEFHEHRPRAPHLEQPLHAPRLHAASRLARAAARMAGAGSVSDLGCGDGGLLQLLKDAPEVGEAWGYDFCPANAEGWAERGVKAELVDVFGADRYRVRLGDVAVLTEVLEHVADPHGVLGWLHAAGPRFVVASSPWDETPEWHDECHAWSFDYAGYRDLLSHAGWRILRHDRVGRFQLILGAKL